MPRQPTPPARRTRPRTMPAGRVVTQDTPSEHDIRKRAYEIYVARGANGGDPIADWRQAEEELRGRMALLGRR